MKLEIAKAHYESTLLLQMMTRWRQKQLNQSLLFSVATFGGNESLCDTSFGMNSSTVDFGEEQGLTSSMSVSNVQKASRVESKSPTKHRVKKTVTLRK
jgi:hypothetical protein